MSIFNPNFDPAFRRQSAPLFNPLPPMTQSNPYGGLLDPGANWQSPVTQGNVGGGSTTSGSGSGVGAASGAGTAASKPDITPGTTPGQTGDPAKTQDPTKQQKPETVSLADVGNANTIAGLIDLSAKVDRMADGYTKRHLQTIISDKIAEIRRSEKWDADRAHEAKTRAHWEGVRQKQAARANPKKDLGWDGDGTATPNTQLTPSTPAPTATPAATPAPAPAAAPAQKFNNDPDLEASFADEQSKNEGMLQQARGMLERGEITTEQYRALTGRDGAWILKEKAKKTAPAPAAPAPATTSTPTRANMGPTTADLYPQGMPGDTPSMSERFAGTAVGKAALAAGDFTKDLVTMLTPGGNDNNVHHEPYVPYVPAKQGEDLERFLPRTLRQDNPRLSNEAKLRGLQSKYSLYMHNLQMAYERGSLSSTDYGDMRRAATNNYQLERDIIEGAISDAAPAPVPTPTPPPPQSQFAAGLNANAAASDSFGNAVGSAFDAADDLKLAHDRAVGGAVASGVDALTSAKDAIQLKTGQAMQALLNELSSGRITMEQFNKLRSMIPDLPPPRMPRAPF